MHYSSLISALTISVLFTVQTTNATDTVVINHQKNGNPSFIKGILFELDVIALDKSIPFHHSTLNTLLNIDSGTEFNVLSKSSNPANNVTYLRLGVTINDLPVKDGQVILHINQHHRVYEIYSNIPPATGVATKPTLLSKNQILNNLKLQLPHKKASTAKLQGTPQLAYAINNDEQLILSWQMSICFQKNATKDCVDETSVIDATTGALLYSESHHHEIAFTVIYDDVYQNTRADPSNYAGKIRQNMENTVLFFRDRFNRPAYFRDRIEGEPFWQPLHVLKILIDEPGNGFNQTSWTSGSISFFSFGGGDGITYAPLGNALDVVAHEYVHAITEHTARLNYSGESGAINEAMSDIFSTVAEKDILYPDYNIAHLPQIWTIGEAVYTPGVHGDAFRYMSDPAKDGSSKDFYPDRYQGYSDNGGIHWNSGIANLAFYLLSAGGTHPRGKTTYRVPGVGIDKAADIFYGALHHRLISRDGFKELRTKTVEEAHALDPTGHLGLRDAVCIAWDTVGVPKQASSICAS